MLDFVANIGKPRLRAAWTPLDVLFVDKVIVGLQKNFKSAFGSQIV